MRSESSASKRAPRSITVSSVPFGLRNTFVLVAIALAMTVGTAAGAAVPNAGLRTPEAWTKRFCGEFVGFQSAALDARDAAFPAARGPVTDATQVRTAATTIRAALLAPAESAQRLARGLLARAPSGARGAEVGDALADSAARIADTYAAARDQTKALARVKPIAFNARATRVLGDLDRSLVSTGNRLARLETTVRKSSLADEFPARVECANLGIDWSDLAQERDTRGTPPPAPIAANTPGVDDVNAPSLLLPRTFRPSPSAATVASRTQMSGLGRTFFYGGEPAIEAGNAFALHCPSPEARTLQILGCYHDARIYVLAVSRPELASVVDVTAGHEMLHAVYDAMDDDARAAIDPQLTSFFDASTDTHLRQIVARYEQRTPENRVNELHSLIGTQVTTLTPALDAHYAKYFHDRAPTTNAYTAYISVFDGLLARYHDLDTQLDVLAGRITSLQDQANAAGNEAQRLGSQIETLRAQGRIGESNALVAAQNDAVRRGQSLSAQANGIIGQFNETVSEINGVAAQLGSLEAALRPAG